MKKWTSAVISVVCLTFAACGGDNKSASGNGEDKGTPEKKSLEVKQPAETAKKPETQSEKERIAVPPVSPNPVTPDADQGDVAEIEIPKSRVFGAIGRAFLRGGTEGSSSDDSPPELNEAN